MVPSVANKVTILDDSIHLKFIDAINTYLEYILTIQKQTRKALKMRKTGTLQKIQFGKIHFEKNVIVPWSTDALYC